MDTVALDQESATWVRELQDHGGSRERAVARLHALLVRVARGEASRRRATFPDRATEEVDDLCVQAANDALMAILAKLDTYRGEARFTTWACKFAIFETSTRLATPRVAAAKGGARRHDLGSVAGYCAAGASAVWRTIS